MQRSTYMARMYMILILIMISCAALVASSTPGTVLCGATTPCCAPPGKCASSSCMDGSGRTVSCDTLKANHLGAMLLDSLSLQPEDTQQQQQQHPAHMRWPQQRRPSWPRLLLPKLLQSGQQQPAASDVMPAQGPPPDWITQLPPAVRRRNRRALQQLGGPVDALMVGGLGSILGRGGSSSGSSSSSMPGMTGLTSLAGMTGMGGLAGLLGSGSSSSNMAALTGMGGVAGLPGGSNTIADLTGSSNSVAGLGGMAGGGNSMAGLAGAAGGSRSSIGGPAAYQQQQQRQQKQEQRAYAHPGGLEQGYGMYDGGSSGNFGSSNMAAGYGGSSNIGSMTTGLNSNVIYSGQPNGGVQAATDPAMLQRSDQTGEQLALNMAPYVQNAHYNVGGMVNTMGPMGVQAKGDVAGLAAQAAQQFPNGVQSLSSGAATAIGAAAPYLLNSGNMLNQGAQAVQQVAQAKQSIMHNTVVPIASAGISTAGNIGNYMGSGFADGFGEGYTAANDRRAPYTDGPSAQQEFESQPALYLPQSFYPLGAMANITYPCPRSAVGNFVAPVGTIIGPGIPCGVNLQVVPRSAVPSNRLAPAVVNVIPFASPVPPPAPTPSSPTPIPVTPLPPTPGGGSTLPPIVPPIVNPSPAPGGTPPIVPPIVSPASPAPGGTTIPTTPPPTTLPGASPAPGGLPPGIVPPNVNPATPASFTTRFTRPSYMAVPEAGQYNLPAAVPVVQITGPYNNINEAAATVVQNRGSIGSRMRRSASVLAQQQQQQQQQQQHEAGSGSLWRSFLSRG